MIAGEVDREIAANAATNRHDFLVALERAEKEHAADARAAAEAAKPEPPPVRRADAAVGQSVPGLRVAKEPTRE